MKLTTLTKILASSLTIASLLAFAMPANAVKVPAGVKLAEKQELNFNAEVPETLDPSLASTSADIGDIEHIFDTLTRLGPDGDYIPVAAESWSVSEDGLTWTFNLRKNAKWQDGKPVRAQDFVYSWRRVTDNKTASPYGFYLGMANVVNADEINKGKAKPETLGVKALDDYTLEVKLSKPTPWFDQMVSLAVLVPLREDIIEKYGSNWTKAGNLVGNGPFIFKSYAFNDYMHYVKWPEYWGANEIVIEKINYDFINSTNNGYFGYLTGKYLLATIPPVYKKKVLETRPEEIRSYSKPQSSWIIFNPARIKDVNVRHAVALLIDRETLTNKIFNFGKPTTNFVPTSLLDGKDLKEDYYFNHSYQENVKEANKILKKAGYSKANPAKISYLTTPNNKKFMNAFKYWINKNSGGKIKLDYQILESKAYMDAKRQKKFDLAYDGWYPDYYQVSTYFNIFFCDSGVNFAGYCNPEYDKIVKEANVNPNPEVRRVLYGKALELIRKDYVVIPTYIASADILISPALGGFNLDLPRRYIRDYYIIADKHVKED